jgi:hypothetical protein
MTAHKLSVFTAALLHACSANPGYVDQIIYLDDLGSGWGWRTYGAKDTKLMAEGEGISGNATCATLSKDGAIPFFCRDCTRPGYQPFTKANILQFWIRSNTKSLDPFASSTPPGKLPELKVFLMNVSTVVTCCSGWITNWTVPKLLNPEAWPQHTP